MENQPSYKRTHPMVPIAAGAVVIMSLIGIGVFTGIIPSSMGMRAEQPVALAPATTTAPLPAAAVPAPRPHTAPPVPRDAYYTPPRPAPVAAPAPVVAVQCVSCGRVESVQTVETAGKASGIGAVAGGVGGAVVGNQVGNGNGRTAMTILGAAGGALAGNAVEKHMHKDVTYNVNVRMDDGSTRSFPASAPGAFAVGERVRVDNGALVRAG